jgi:hypothetical protein
MNVSSKEVMNSSRIQPAPFQIEDMEQLQDRTWSSNWSEMGLSVVTRLQLFVGSFQNGQNS